MNELNLTVSKNKKIYITDIAGDCICVLMSSSVILLVLFDLLALEAALWHCIVLSIISISLLLIFTRKWWIFPVVVLGGAFLTITFFVVFGLFNDVITYLAGLYEWILAAFPVMLPYSENGSMLTVQLLIALPINAVIFLYFRSLFFFSIQPPGLVALLAWLHFRQSEFFITVLAFSLVSIIVSLAKHTGRRLNKRHSAKNRLPEGMMQLPALAIALLVLLFSFAFSPNTDGSWQSEGLVDLVNDVSDYLDFRIYGKGGKGSFNISQSGFMPYGDTLGGDIAPNNDVVLRISTEMPVLLLASVNNTYTGSSWLDTGLLGRFRFNSALWQNTRRETFNLNRPLGGKAAADIYNSITKTIELKITPTIISYTLFSTGKPLSLTTLNEGRIDAYFNLQSELFYEEGWRAHNSYIFRSIVYDHSIDDFDRKLLELEALTSEKSDGYYEDIKEQYLQLPDTLPETISKLAREITDGAFSPYEKALAIKAWLAENCTYTLTPGGIPEGRDFVEYFLETKQGYCTYYASAMTILSRCVGLPARYCSGYAMKRAPDERENSFLATNKTAHAWSEIYFSGIGWISFDPSGLNFYEPVETDEPSDIDAPVQPPVLPENEAIINEPPEDTAISTPEVDIPHSGPANRLQLLAFPALLFILVLLFLIIRFMILYLGTGSYHKRLRRKYPLIGDRLDAAYRKLLRQLEFIGLKIDNADTISTFARRVDEYMGNNKMSRICQPVIRYRFGKSNITDAEVKALCDHYAETESKIRHEMGLGRYLIRRVLLGR